MRLLLVHPSALMYSEIFLRLEPLGLERVAGAAREAGHEVRVVDLQVLGVNRLRDEVRSFRPEALGVSLNYLANIPEAIALAARVKREVPDCFVFFGGHSVSFVAEEVIEQAEGAVDAVVRGEGEPAVAPLLEAVRDGGVEGVPGVVTAAGRGPAPLMLLGSSSDGRQPAPFNRNSAKQNLPGLECRRASHPGFPRAHSRPTQWRQLLNEHRT
jgi:magnesium-protoporphyrin IX monomethyl ester (oxidative) cyclase